MRGYANTYRLIQRIVHANRNPKDIRQPQVHCKKDETPINLVPGYIKDVVGDKEKHTIVAAYLSVCHNGGSTNIAHL